MKRAKLNDFYQIGFLPFLFLNFLSLGFYARHLWANYATLIFCGVGMAGGENHFMANQGR